MIHSLLFLKKIKSKCGCSHGVFDICREDSDNSVTAYFCIKMHPNVHIHVLVDLCFLTRQARQQQAEIAQQEWLQMQQAAQQAQIAASSANPAQQTNSSQDEDEEEDM